LIGALLARRIGLERTVVLSILVMAAGHLVRALAGSYVGLLVGTVVVFAGIGVANILLPPLVKRYFPDRIGLVTTVYASVMAISTAVPAALAAPVAGSAGWRLSLGIWSVLAFASLLPWLVVLVQHRRERGLAASALEYDEAPELPEPEARLLGSIWHSRTAWALTLIFALSGFHAYTAFAWLPQMLIDVAGVTPVQAGALLALFGIVGLPCALIVPVLASRMRNVGVLVQIGIAAFVAGYLGLMLVPGTWTALWVVLAGLGTMLFPAALVLINLRTRTADGSVALSGFVQGVGYTIALVGPILVGLLHETSGGWSIPLMLLIGTALACTVPGLMLRRPAFVEDEVELDDRRPERLSDAL
ncbi:MAG TPA: MFS transporter, partial [Marisediminicola sp.]|nr:MFS transporter [Marisediminicola sp.]